MEQLQLSAQSIIALFDTTKEERKSFAERIISEITDGNVNPLDIHLQLKCAEDLIKNINGNEQYKEMLLAEAQKHGKSFAFKTAKVEVKETGVKYDYSQCGDIVYNELEKQFKDIEAKLKERQKFLQLMPEGGQVLTDTDSGETYTAYKAVKSSTTSIAVTLK